MTISLSTPPTPATLAGDDGATPDEDRAALTDVEHVGQKGDIVDVADGYARNFLVPRGLALRATVGRAEAGRRHAPQPRRPRPARPGGGPGHRRPARTRRSGSRPGPAKAAGCSDRSPRPTSPRRCRPSSGSRSTAGTSRSTSRSRSSVSPRWPSGCTATSPRRCTSRSSRASGHRARPAAGPESLSTLRPQPPPVPECARPYLWTTCVRPAAVARSVSQVSGTIPSVVEIRPASPQVSHTVVPLSTHRPNVRHSRAAPPTVPPGCDSRLRRRGSTPWSSRSTTPDDDRPMVGAAAPTGVRRRGSLRTISRPRSRSSAR